MGLPLPLLNLRRRLAGGISPAALFLNSEPGVWYDPSDLTTMFQDRAGTTLVTTPGQSVGLVLDKRLGLTPGPELVTNGTFDDATGWGLTGSGAISGGRFISGAAGDKAQQTLSATVANKTYLITLTGVVGSIGIRLGQDTSNQATFSADGSAYVVGASSTNILTLRASVSGAEVSSISVREIPGNHMVATADASRGTYGIEPFGGRRNLLTFTEQFDNADWGKTRVTVTANATVAPDGTTTADRLVGTAETDVKGTFMVGRTVANAAHTWTIRAKYDNLQWIAINAFDGSTNRTYFDILNGVVGVTGSGVTASIDSIGDGWYLCRVSRTTAASVNAGIGINLAPADGVFSFTSATGGEAAFIWGAQLEVGSTATPYQRVTTAFDVTEAGVPTVHYVQFDGADDGYLTSTITPGTDKVQVFAGVRKLSDAATGMLAELSFSIATNNGTFRFDAPISALPNYNFSSRGTTIRNATSASSFAAPQSAALTGLGDISGDRATLRVNGTQVAQSTADQGTGNYLAYPLYIGRRGGSSLPFNGRLYQLAVRFGPNLDASRIEQVERFINSKTGAY